MEGLEIRVKMNYRSTYRLCYKDPWTPGKFNPHNTCHGWHSISIRSFKIWWHIKLQFIWVLLHLRPTMRSYMTHAPGTQQLNNKKFGSLIQNTRTLQCILTLLSWLFNKHNDWLYRLLVGKIDVNPRQCAMVFAHCVCLGWIWRDNYH